MRRYVRIPLALLAALVLLALGASATSQLAGGAVSVALAVPVIVWLGVETPVVEGAIGAALVGVLLDAAAGGPGGLLTFLSVMIVVGVRAGAGPFDARSDLGFALLSGAATFTMGFGAILLTRYVTQEGSRAGLVLAGARARRVAPHRPGRARSPLGARPHRGPGPPRPAGGPAMTRGLP